MTSGAAESPVIAVSITHGFQARNLLQTDVSRLLVRAGFEVVVISPAAAQSDFQQKFGMPGVSFVPAHSRPTQLTNVFMMVRRYALSNPRRNATFNLFNEKYLSSRNPFYVFLRGFNRLTGRMPWLRGAWMRLEGVIVPGREWDDVLKKLKPVLVVTGTPGTEHLDALLLRSAKRLGIPTACVVLSWDNLTSKGHMAARPDRLIVWNERMLGEAVELHDYHDRDIDVAGVAHFDVYARPATFLPRKEICARLGLDTARPIITFGTVTPFLFPYNQDIAEMLARAATDGSIEGSPQIVVRLHPQAAGGGAYGEPLDGYHKLKDAFPGVVALDIPQVSRSSIQWLQSADEMVWLASLLRESAVCINVASTLAIDAVLANTPVIGIAFDGYRTLPYSRSIRRAYDYTHYKPITESGGVPLARSLEELVALVNRYIEDPTLDSDGRRRIAREHAGEVDGRAGERVAAAIARAARPRIGSVSSRDRQRR